MLPCAFLSLNVSYVLNENIMNEKLKKIYPDFQEWQSDWMKVPRDVEYRKKIVDIMEPFVEVLIDNGLTKKMLIKHLSNLSWFGKKLIHEVNQNKDYNKDVHDLIISI